MCRLRRGKIKELGSNSTFKIPPIKLRVKSYEKGELEVAVADTDKYSHSGGNHTWRYQLYVKE